MNGKNFGQGIYLPQYKKKNVSEKIKEISIPEEIILPLNQHTGSTCSPLVKKGDKVRTGDLIADSNTSMSAKIHASICGIVEDVGPRPYFTRTLVESVVIKPFKEQTPPKWKSRYFKTNELSLEEIIQKTQEAGIVGMGGAAFPTHIKLQPPSDIDVVIINACESEPFLTCDHQAMIQMPDALLEGAQLIKQAVNASQVYIGINKDKQNIAKVIRQKAKQYNIKVIILDTKYPQGAEKQLIKSIVDREVPPGKLPFDVGVIVQNVNTAVAVYEAVKYEKPLIERIITVSGDGINNPANVKVRLGTPIKHVIEECGGVKEASLEETRMDTSDVRYPVSTQTHLVGKVIMGGPMTGETQTNLNVPIIKGTTGVLILTPEMLNDNRDYMACVRCARCVSACPLLLYPNYIGVYAETGRFKLAEEWGALDCYECGICEYICPSRRPNVKFVRDVKMINSYKGTEKKFL